jgi:hypothetical protein
MEEVINNNDKIQKLKTLGVKNLSRFSWCNSTTKLKSIIEELI